MDLSGVSISGRTLRTLGLTVPLLAAFLYQAACGGNHSTSIVPVNPTPSPSPGQTDVVTYHYDNARTGAHLNETVLTPANVNATKFVKIGFYSVDGKVDGQPVYLSQVSISGQGTHNVLYVVSEHGSVYAFDADSGTTLWHVSLLGSGETPSDPHNCFQIVPEIGITSTPVIDRSRAPHGALYTVAMSKNGTGNYFQRIHALDITTGAELFGGPATVTASYPGTGDNSTGGSVIFDARQYAERAGLLLLNGTVYTTWTSHCDQRPYTGWIIGYDANTLTQTKVLNVTPNGSEGSIWMSGTAPAADSNGNIYVVDRNAMGKFNPSADNIYQEIPGAFTDGVFSMPAYFNNTVYYGAVGNTIKAFPISNAKLATTASSKTGNAFPYPGATPSISANGTSNAIVWAVENSSPAVVHAYDATNLDKELYNSSQASGSRDQFGAGNKFITPMIVNGKVYVGTTSGVAVFGLLP